jgi:hypothetical protein
MNLSSLSDQVLLERTSGLVKEERRVTLWVLWHLREIERRRLFAERGFDSLFTFCTRGLGYSEGAASRRILAMRLLKDCPELEEKILDGRVSLSVAAQIQRVAKKAVIPSGEQKEVSGFEESNLTDWKSSLVNRVEGMSARDAEKVLLEFAPEEIGPERTRRLTPATTEIRLVVDESLKEKLDRLKSLLSHVNPSMTYSELIERLADIGLRKLDPGNENARPNRKVVGSRVKGESSGTSRVKTKHKAASVSVSHDDNATLPSEGELMVSKDTRCARRRRVRIPSKTRRVVWMRDHGKCSYQDSLTSQRCESRHLLEIDHVMPVACGGSNDIENLRLVCRAHNTMFATQVFGKKKMAAYLNQCTFELSAPVGP